MFGAKISTITRKWAFFIMAVLMGYPIIDYVLRNIIPIPILSSVWDELFMFAGLTLVGLKILLSSIERSSRISAGISFVVVAGLAYTIQNMTTFGVNLEGFRAIFEYMFVFFIGFYLSNNPEETRKLLSIAALVGLVMALHGIYQWIAKVPMPGDWVDSTETAVRTRSFSIVGSPNALGSQMAMMASITLGLFMAENHKAKKLFWLVAFGIMAICLIFTGSRGAWLAFAAAIGVIGIIFDRRILIAGIVFSILAGVFVPAVSHRITYLFSAEYMVKSQQSGRISRWFEAYDQMRNNPLFGAGLGHFGGAVAKREFNTIYVDNYYMKTLAEMGLFGLSMFLWLMGRIIRNTYGAMKSVANSEYKFLGVGMFAGILAIIFHNGVENIFEIPYLNTYFWLVTGLLSALPFTIATGGKSDE